MTKPFKYYDFDSASQVGMHLTLNVRDFCFVLKQRKGVGFLLKYILTNF